MRWIGLLLRLYLLFDGLWRHACHRHVLEVVSIVKSSLRWHLHLVGGRPRHLRRTSLVWHARWTSSTRHRLRHVVLRWWVHAASATWNVLVEHLAVHVAIHPLVLRRLHGGDGAHVAMMEVSVLLLLHLVVHSVLGRGQLLLHVGGRVRVVVAVRNVHEATSAGHGLIRLGRQSRSPKVQTLIHHRRLVKLRWAACVHSVHVVLLAAVKSTRLVLALCKHLGGLHEARAKTRVVLRGRRLT